MQEIATSPHSPSAESGSSMQAILEQARKLVAVRLTVINRFVEPLQTRISVVKRVTSGTITVKRTATRKLSPVDKAQLIIEIASSMKEVLDSTVSEKPPQFIGIWAGLDLTDADIAEARQEMWGNFPREDI